MVEDQSVSVSGIYENRVTRNEIATLSSDTQKLSGNIRCNSNHFFVNERLCRTYEINVK